MALVKSILDKNLDEVKRLLQEQTPSIPDMLVAVINGDVPILEEILKLVTVGGNQELYHACYHGNREMIKYLLSLPQINAVDIQQAVEVTTLLGCLDVIELLSTHKLYNPATPLNYPLANACLSRNVNLVKFILSDERVLVNSNNNIAYHVANDNEEIKALLLEKGAKPDLDYSGKEYKVPRLKKIHKDCNCTKKVVNTNISCCSKKRCLS